ncbi:eCIS core domain-containing protein [Pedobacter steynii]
MKGTSGSHETVNQQTKVADTPKAASLQNENNQPNSTNELVYHNQPKLKAEVSDQIEASRGAGTQMDGDTQSFMESRFGTGFSDVNIHVGTDASQLSNSLNAKAFTVGKDIYFNENMYHPNSAEGRHLLAHELTHTIQQNGNTIQRSPMPGEDTVQNLESYDAATRQNIHYDIGFNLQTNISLFFQKGIVRDVRSGYNVTYVVKGFDPAEAWVESAMRALILYNFNLNKDATDAAITNITTVQHLDLSGETNPSDAKITGPNAMVRFTSTEFDATGKGAKK